MRKFLSLFTVLVLCNVMTFAQTKVVTGKVTDQQGQPIPFASIRVKGAKTGTSADADGNFSIKADPSQSLIVSGTGITEKTLLVGNESTVTISVNRTNSALTEVVVTSLGIQRQSKELGYSAAKISSKEVTQAKPISLVNGLTGKVSGLQINTTNNGLFAPTRITLRGNRSLTGNNQPLIVVDGAIYYSDISTLNPQDVADMTILKGSSASAVYGSDASNGVIVVTTKHGTRNSKPTLTFSSSVSLEKVSYMPAYQERFGSDGGEVPYILDFNDLSTYVPYENQSYGPEYNGKLVPLGRPTFDSNLLVVPYKAVKNQKRDFFQTGLTTQQNLSFASGDENGNFFMSLQDLKSKAVMYKDQGRRDIFRIGGVKRYGIFSASYSLAYTYKTTDTTDTYDVYQNMIESPTLVPLNRLKYWRTAKFASPSEYYNDYYPNPWVSIDNARNSNTEHHVNGNLLLSLKPFKWLTVAWRTSIDNTNHYYERKGAELTYTSWALTNKNVVYSNYDGSKFDTVSESTKYNASGDNPHPATYGTYQLNNLLWASDGLAIFNIPFARDWKFTGTLGVSYLDNKISFTPIGILNGGGPLVFPVYNPSNYSSVANVLGAGQSEARKLGYFGEGGFSFKNFAFIHGSYRTDIDSRLSKDNRYIPYYDIDGALVISDLIPKMNESKVFNYAKIRFAHSRTGNVSALAGGSPYIAFGAYATVPTLSAGPGFPYSSSGLTGYNLTTTIANPNIKPEQVTENEAGLDLGFFEDRLNVGLSAYKSTTTDGIVYAQVSRATGSNSALINAATTTNKGVEADVRAAIVKGKDWRWDVGVNWTHNVSNVERINGDVKSIALGGANGNAYAEVGHPYPVIETYDWVRDSVSGKVIVDANSGTPSKSSQLSILGNANPKDILGFTTNVGYKNFSLAVTADYRTGYSIFNAIANTMDHSGVGITTAKAGRQSFVYPNSVYLDPSGKSNSYINNTNVTVADGNYFWPNVYRTVGANYVTSAAAWKLREVVLSYSLPQIWLNASRGVVKGATLSVSGRNLLMIRPKSNVWTDPEFSEDSGNGVGRNSEGQTPPTRFYTATISVTF